MALISHDNVEALIPTQEVREIFKSVIEDSFVLKHCTRLPDMTSKQTKLNVESALPLVYWQETPTSYKKTTSAAWKKVFLTAEEIAVIVPIAQADLDDANYDIFGQVKPRIVEAIKATLDEAVLFGHSGSKPASFPEGIAYQAVTANHNVTETNNLYKDISDAMGLVEEDGYDVTGLVGGPSVKKLFRDLTDTTGRPLTGDEITSLPRTIVKNGAWDKTLAKVIVGDFSQAVYAIRQDVEVKLLTEGVIQDPANGNIVYNLAQQDMVALRITFRFGWALPNPVNRINPDEEGRLPFAAVVPND